MRALTKNDMALIRGGVGSGYSSLEAALSDAITEASIADSNMDYDAIVMDSIDAEINDLLIDEGSTTDPSVFLADEAEIDVLLAEGIYYQSNYNDNAAASDYWNSEIVVIEAEIAALPH